MYVCMHVCMYACMHACMYVCMHACMYVCMHACMYVCVVLYVCMYVSAVITYKLLALIKLSITHKTQPICNYNITFVSPISHPLSQPSRIPRDTSTYKYLKWPDFHSRGPGGVVGKVYH